MAQFLQCCSFFFKSQRQTNTPANKISNAENEEVKDKTAIIEKAPKEKNNAFLHTTKIRTGPPASSQVQESSSFAENPKMHSNLDLTQRAPSMNQQAGSNSLSSRSQYNEMRQSDVDLHSNINEERSNKPKEESAQQSLEVPKSRQKLVEKKKRRRKIKE